jgi:hypothetical protein
MLAYAIVGYLGQVRDATLGQSETPLTGIQPIRGEWTRLPAWRYARAVADGDVDTAIAMTLWIQDRLAFRRTETGDEVEVANTREELAAALRDRSVEGNRLTAEGVEDQYLFAPGVDFAIVGELPGDSDLEAPAAQKVLFRIAYPRKETALCDSEGRPIHELVAGIETTKDGMVLKAGIAGNAAILRDTIRYDWRQ